MQASPSLQRCRPAARGSSSARWRRRRCRRRGSRRAAGRRPGLPPHTPAWQVSPVVQALPSLQAVPSASAGSSRRPVAGRRCRRRGTGPARRRSPGSSPCRCRAWQVSVCVHALPSLHAVPLRLRRVRAGAGRRVAGAGVVALVGRRAASPGCRRRRRRAWQVSVCVQALPSLQAVPSAFGGFEQTPVVGLQVPAHVALVRAPCSVTGFAAGADAAPGRCRSACRRCRRCRRCRWPSPGWSRRRSPGCRCPPCGTGPARCR